MTEIKAMTQYEMTEQLSAKCGVSMEEAKAALESSDWNPLTATHILEQEQFRRMRELSEAASAADEQAAEAPADDLPAAKAPKADRRQGFRNLCDHIRRLIACGNRHRLVIHKGGEQLMELPVTLLALLLACSFGTCALLLAVGLFAGCRYSIDGEGLNGAAARS